MISRRHFVGGAALAVASFNAGCRARQPLQATDGESPPSGVFELQELSLSELQDGLRSRRWTGEHVTQLYLDRIEALDRDGPRLGAIIRTNPDALAIARQLDRERQTGRIRGPLHGIPVVIKDNIETADSMPTTAGSLALRNSIPTRDAPLVSLLRDAGAVVLAKTNLSEWANFRGANSTSGWSAVGGQCRNPYALDRNPCGSSSGSAVAVSTNMAPIAVGTETDGSIVCPSAKNGIVGIKPTVGLVSRTGVIPLAKSQDTAGPMARTVRDAALLLGVMAEPDNMDPATLSAPTTFPTDYTQFLDADGLRGARIGIVRNFSFDRSVWSYFEDSLQALRDAGAVVIDPVEIPNLDRLSGPEFTVLLYEFKDGINRYLSGLDDRVPVHSLEELIAFNESNVEREMPYFGQERFRAAFSRGELTDPAYLNAIAACRQLSRSEGIDAVMDRFDLDALVSPEGGLPWLTDYERGDQYTGNNSRPAAVAGYPNVTVPMGLLDGLPLGISFFGRAWSEPVLIRLAFAYEQATNRRERPRFQSTASQTERAS